MKYALLIGMLLLVGCSSTHKFTVSVRNDSLEPMTIWLTKDGPPAELGWLSPEQLVSSGLSERAPVDQLAPVVPAGKTAELKEIEGTFDAGYHAVLRIYRGQKPFNTLLAVSKGSVNRTDIVLSPGANKIRIDKDGKAYK